MAKAAKVACEKKFYGAVSVGERGQVVIPKEARDDYGISPGEKLIVLGRPGGALILLKAEGVRDLARQILDAV